MKADPINALILRKQFDAITPGYHLNKKHWNTVTLDGSVPDKELVAMIDESYTLVVQGMCCADKTILKKMELLKDGKESG